MGFSDLTPLSSLTQLKSLSLRQNKISNLDPIKNLSNIESLELGMNEITDITPILTLTKLKNINLSRSPLKPGSTMPQIHAKGKLMLPEGFKSGITKTN